MENETLMVPWPWLVSAFFLGVTLSSAYFAWERRRAVRRLWKDLLDSAVRRDGNAIYLPREFFEKKGVL